jgi:hypothetical protein
MIEKEIMIVILEKLNVDREMIVDLVKKKEVDQEAGIIIEMT